MSLASAIPRITGRFRTRVKTDLVGSITVGIVCATAHWKLVSVPSFEKWEIHDAAVRAATLKENDEWMTENNYSRQ